MFICIQYLNAYVQSNVSHFMCVALSVFLAVQLCMMLLGISQQPRGTVGRDKNNTYLVLPELGHVSNDSNRLFVCCVPCWLAFWDPGTGSIYGELNSIYAAI